MQKANPEALLDTVLQNLTNADLLTETVILAFERDVLLRAQPLCPEIETNFLTNNRKYLEHSDWKLKSFNPNGLYTKVFSKNSDLSFAEYIEK